MSAEREIMEWLENVEDFNHPDDEAMRQKAIQVLAEHVQYDSEDDD